MARELRLLPLIGQNYWAAHEMLKVDWWDAIKEVRQSEIPQPLYCHLARNADDSETIYGQITEDPYGEPLMWTTAGRLAALADQDEARTSWRNRAVFAWLAQMPEDHMIVLYWY